MNKSNSYVRTMVGAILAISTLSLVGCTSSDYSSTRYSGSQAKQAQTVREGTVVAVRHVKIDGKETNYGIGTVGGAVLGGIAGNAFGGGLGRVATTAAGVVVGGLAGNAVEGAVREENGLEIQVRMSSGEVVSIVQKADVAFSVGQKVKVIGSGRDVRVTH